MNQGVRLALALFLSVGISFVYMTFVAPAVSPELMQPQEVVVQTSTDPSKGSVVATDPASKTSTTQTAATIAAATLVVLDQAETQAEAKDITIQTSVADIILSTQGGVLTGYGLNDYQTEVVKGSPDINLLKEHAGSTSLYLGFKGYSQFTADKVFQLVRDEKLKSGERQVELSWKNSDIQINKTFRFNQMETEYGIRVDYQVTNLSDRDMNLSPYLQSRLLQKAKPKKEGGVLSFLKFEQPDVFMRLFYKDDSLDTQMEWDEFKGGEAATGKIDWAAISDRYFIFAHLPVKTDTAAHTASFDREGDFLVGQLQSSEMAIPAGKAVTGSFLSYVGPKKSDQLRVMGANLDQSIDYGWFSILATPILMLMTFLHTFIPNWGLVIIILTFMIKVMLHPVNKKSMQSMKAMQQLQPKMADIKKKYKDDKEKLNQEVMKLFKTHKVNPMGGCLPMVLQMPIYIVLYKVLWNSIELFHAPFFWVYQDLSAPDPYFVLPALLGVFMFLQQKLTPNATADASQQKMMMFMPVMFTGFMLFLPVGLVVYIFVNTVISVVQQFMIKREISFKQFVTGKWQPKEA